MRYLFVDRVLQLHRGERILAVRGVSGNESYFQMHFPSQPVMPGALLIECFAQAGSFLLEVSSGFRHKALPIFIRDAKFRRPVRPGPEMRISLAVEQQQGESAVLSGEITQAGVVCATATIGFAGLPVEGFYGAALPVVRSLYASWMEGAELHGFDRHPLESLGHG
ncbi:MAG TPA: hypothetical protein VFA20_26300 [Myxococcaceae bacterium]|nr:hypothetical protein [Myxococcaceae bacterium]